jgi:hypothetical protein
VTPPATWAPGSVRVPGFAGSGVRGTGVTAPTPSLAACNRPRGFGVCQQCGGAGCAPAARRPRPSETPPQPAGLALTKRPPTRSALCQAWGYPPKGGETCQMCGCPPKPLESGESCQTCSCSPKPLGGTKRWMSAPPKRTAGSTERRAAPTERSTSAPESRTASPERGMEPPERTAGPVYTPVRLKHGHARGLQQPRKRFLVGSEPR